MVKDEAYSNNACTEDDLKESIQNTVFIFTGKTSTCNAERVCYVRRMPAIDHGVLSCAMCVSKPKVTISSTFFKYGE
jgi:hypothetical protein